MDKIFTAIANRIASFVGQPLAFVLALAFIIVWAVTGPMFAFSDTWQLIVNTSTTIVTFLIVFLIQNSQNRDAAALQAKLDELIRVTKAARNQFIGIEHLTETELEKIRAALESDCGQDDKDPSTSHASVERLLGRT